MMKFIRRSIKRFIKRSIRKIIKNRKIIAFFLVFTLSFSLVSNYKKEEPKAEVITLTTGVILACAMLAVSAGVVITNQDMIEDVGTRVWNGIKDSYGTAFTVDGERIKVNTTVNLFNDIVSICKELPTVATTVFKSVFTPSTDYVITGRTSIGLSLQLGMNTPGGLVVMKNNSSQPIQVYARYTSKSGTYITIPGDATFEFSYYIGLIDNKYKLAGSINGEDFTIVPNYVYEDIQKVISTLTFNVYGGSTFDVINYYSYDDYVSIPYTEENSKSVSADIPKTYFPTYGGSISVPVDKPITDYVPSVSAPITKPQDFVGVGTGDIVIESDTVSDNVGTGEDSLTGVGDSILNPTFSKTIDLSPLYMDLSTKFPFSIPFDIYNLFKDFEVSKKRPVVSYSLPEKYFGTNKMEVDFAFYDDIFPFTTILRYFLLIGFVYFLIIKTRNLIGG